MAAAWIMAITAFVCLILTGKEVPTKTKPVRMIGYFICSFYTLIVVVSVVFITTGGPQ